MFFFSDQILLPEDTPMTDTPMITGTLLTLKLLLPLFQFPSNPANENLNTNHLSVSVKKIANLNAVASERIVQVSRNFTLNLKKINYSVFLRRSLS